MLDAYRKKVRSFFQNFFENNNLLFKILEKVIVPVENPCLPSPCGPNSVCRIVDNHAACSCLPNYVGRAPNCRPECTINSECPGNLACLNERCKDPCPGSCGIFTNCIVLNHAPICQCDAGYTGDPFAGCSPIPGKKGTIKDRLIK